MPYLVCSEGHHVASGALNRWTLQPGITDVKSQVQAMAPWVAANLGKKVTMIYPDYAFGYDHRDFFTAAIEAQGGAVIELLAIPPTETSFTRYLPRIPAETEVHLPRHGRPGGPHLRQGARRVLRRRRPPARSSASSTASRPSTSPAPASSSSRAATSGRATRATCSPAPPSSRPPTAPRSASTTTAPRSPTQGRLDLRPHVLDLGDALRHQGGDGGRLLPGPRRPPGDGRGDRGDDRVARPAPSTRRATRSSTARPTRSSATSRSRRSRAAGSPSCTPPRSRTASTPTRSTTRP